MYASHPASSRFGHSALPHADMYSRVGVETSVCDASPHRLVALLFDGFAESAAQAKAAIAAKQTEAKGQAIGRAARIVEEGLKASLDHQAGGALAADLADLYAYIGLRLTQANLRNDMAALDECLALMQPLREAWASIAPQVDGPRG
ncbi:MAG: flagellar export chaperone FliS [Aquincola sp.]|nr:flagellar export chaperone FliS [Aquincola sp.]MDH5330858.1 flagellar export chaperone FliS [Aquincola sp.]